MQIYILGTLIYIKEKKKLNKGVAYTNILLIQWYLTHFFVFQFYKIFYFV